MQPKKNEKKAATALTDADLIAEESNKYVNNEKKKYPISDTSSINTGNEGEIAPLATPNETLNINTSQLETSSVPSDVPAEWEVKGTRTKPDKGVAMQANLPIVEKQGVGPTAKPTGIGTSDADVDNTTLNLPLIKVSNTPTESVVEADEQTDNGDEVTEDTTVKETPEGSEAEETVKEQPTEQKEQPAPPEPTTDVEAEGPQGNMDNDEEENTDNNNLNEEDDESENDEGEKHPMPQSADDIPDSPDEWEKIIADNPEMIQNIYDYFTNLDKNAKKDERKERRAALGQAFGNLMRSMVNLYYTAGKGGVNAYDNETAQKNVNAVHDRYEKARKAQLERHKEMWNFLQNIRSQRLKEQAQKHKEEVDSINLQLKQMEAQWKKELSEAQARLTAAKASEQEQKAEKARIDNKYRDEWNNLNNEKVRLQGETEKSKQANNNASAYKNRQLGDKAAKDAESNRIRANAAANAQNKSKGDSAEDVANAIANGNDISLGLQSANNNGTFEIGLSE